MAPVLNVLSYEACSRYSDATPDADCAEFATSLLPLLATPQPAEQAELSDSEIMFLAGKHHVAIQKIEPVLDFARAVLAAAGKQVA